MKMMKTSTKLMPAKKAPAYSELARLLQGEAADRANEAERASRQTG